MIVRNYRLGETIPFTQEQTGMPYLDPEWTWVVEEEKVFAIAITSFAHGWLVLWRVIALPESVPGNWFLEAMPQIFENAKKRGCLGILTMLSDEQDREVRMARMIPKMGGVLIPFKGSMGAALLV